MKAMNPRQCEAGQGMVEYGLIIGFLTIIIIAAMMMLAPQVEAMFAEGIDSEMMGNAKAGISSMIYAPEVAAASALWEGGTYTPDLDFTPISANFPNAGDETPTTVFTLSASDYDQTNTATINISAYDIDAAGEVVVVVNGVEYPLNATGNNVSGVTTLSLPKAALQSGDNSISFKWYNTGHPAGYRIDDLAVTLS